MPLYLDEIWLDTRSRETAKQAYTMFRGMAGGTGYPEGVRLVAGPWFSNEEPKVIVVLDIADHAKTFVPFAGAVALGVIQKRRLEPIVEASALDALLGSL